MLKYKNDTSCIMLIDFGLSKDYSGQPVMCTPSGSVSLSVKLNDKYSPTTSPQRYFNKTTPRKSICGRWVLWCISWYPGRCLFPEGTSWRSSATLSKLSTTSTTKPSTGYQMSAKTSSSTSWLRTWTKDSPPWRLTTTPGPRSTRKRPLRRNLLRVFTMRWRTSLTIFGKRRPR